MCHLQSLKHISRLLLRRIICCLLVFWNIFWAPRTPRKFNICKRMTSAVPEHEAAMALRHKKEVKDLQARASALKKSAPVSDKKRRKEVLAEVEQLELDLQRRHNAEMESLMVKECHPNDDVKTAAGISNGDKQLDSPESGDEERVPLETCPETTVPDDDNENEEKVDSPGQKLTRAQRRRVNKHAKVTQRLAEMKVDDAKPVQISSRTAEKIKLKKILDENNLRLVEVRSDGNCLYHSLVHQLHLNGSIYSVPELRQKTAHYMEKFPDYFKPFLVHHDTGNPFTPEDFAQYLRDIANTNAWGSQVELRAISADLKWPIRVLQAEGTDVLIGEEYCSDSLLPLTIVYHRHELSLGEHYNSVSPK